MHLEPQSIIQILLEDYKARFEEGQKAAESFSNKTTMFISLLSLTIAVAIPLLDFFKNSLNGLPKSLESVIGCLFVFIPVMAAYYHSLLLASGHMILASRYRIASIEKKIREISKVEGVFIWDSVLMQTYQAPKLKVREGIYNVNWIAAVWALFLYIIYAALLVSLAFVYYGDSQTIWKNFPIIYTIICIVVLVIQVVLHYRYWSGTSEAIKKYTIESEKFMEESKI